MLKEKNPKKPLIIVLSVILGIALIIGVLIGGYCLIANAVIYSYVDLPDAFINGVDYPLIENDEDCPRRYPFFGNPLTISADQGASYHCLFNAGEKNLFIYGAINDPIYTWISYLSMRYKNDAKVDYTVEQDSDYITVNFTGTLEENGEIIPIEQKFVFDIRRVSAINAPYWANSDEISEGYRDFLFYCRNQDYPDRIETPDWILNPTH